MRCSLCLPFLIQLNPRYLVDRLSRLELVNEAGPRKKQFEIIKYTIYKDITEFR